MSNDPYATLGVKKTATDAEIKAAYRKLVRKSHPDLNPDDPGAEARFKAISSAYDLLKDPATRARFDAGEIDASGAERPPRDFYRNYTEQPQQPYRQRHGFQDQGDPADIFAEFLRQQGRGGDFSGFDDGSFATRGADMRFSLEIGFLDAVRGAKTDITLPSGAVLQVQIPKGAFEGQTLRLRGKGAPGRDAASAGDALITLKIRPHPIFHREGDDIKLTVPISIDEAVLGAKIPVPTIEGPVNLTIPAGASSGRILRLRGRGVAHGGSVGDQLVELRIVIPSHPDASLTTFFENWKKTQKDDPRKTLFEGV